MSGTVWAPSVDAAGVVERISRAGSIIAVTHSKPDGDAAGSTLAIVRAINRRGGAAIAWFVGPVPHWMGPIAGATPVRVFKGGEPIAADKDPDLVLVLDTGSWSQLRELAGWIRARHDKVIVVDHHLRGDADVSDARLIDTTAPATAQIAAELCRALLGVASPAQLPPDVAEPLYMGLATDTGWFKHENVTPRALRLAADLMEAGASHTRLYQVIEQQDRPGRLKLMAKVLETVEFHNADSVALMALRQRDFAACGAERNDSTGFVELPLVVGSVRVSAVLTEEPADGAGVVTKISLRSKPGPGAVDVNVVSGRLGGGGHARAAGARVAIPLEDAKKALLAALDESR